MAFITVTPQTEEDRDVPKAVIEAFHGIADASTKLKELGIQDLEHILGLNDQELNELCGPEILDLRGVNRLKFKSKVRILRDRTNQQNVPFMAVSTQDQHDLQRLSVAVKQAQDGPVLDFAPVHENVSSTGPCCIIDGKGRRNNSNNKSVIG